MKKLIQIFVEGVEDVRFLSSYINHLLKNKPELKLPIGEKRPKRVSDSNEKIIIQSTGSWTLLENIRNAVKENVDAENIILIIFDADTEHNQGGFEKRKKELKDKFEGIDLNADDCLFLFPNNKDNGHIEVLQSNIVLESRKEIFDCWNNLRSCLNKVNAQSNYTHQKHIMAKYFETDSEKVENKYSVYLDLDHPYLDPLKEFLEAHLNETDTNNSPK